MILDDSDVRDSMVAISMDHGVRAFRELPARQKKAATEMFRAVARGMTDETMSRVREVLLKGIREASQMPSRDRVKHLRRVLSKAQVYGDDKNIVQTVITTQASIANSAAVWMDTFMNPDVWGYELVAKRDARPSHREMHGVRYPKRHKFWRRYFPPNGWNCRCRPRPILYGSPDASIKRFNGVPDVDPGFRFNPGVMISGVN